MNIFCRILILGLLALLCFSCKDNPYDPDSGMNATFSFRSSKCFGQGLSKATFFDSLFTYTFRDTLLIDFSVTANCCPDSNRFIISQKTAMDTIMVLVADTAQNLCRCVCPYLLHVEFADLPFNHYVVRCGFVSVSGAFEQLYLADVYRRK